MNSSNGGSTVHVEGPRLLGNKDRSVMQQDQVPTSHAGEAAGKGFVSIIYAVAWTAEAWLHRGFGVRFIGMKGPLGFGFIVLFAACWEHDDLRPIGVFLGFYTLFWMVAQLWAWCRRLRKKIDGHTRYSGRPHLLRLLPWCSEVTIKRLEPLLVLAAGYFIHHVNRPLGTYLIVAGSALIVTATFQLATEHERVLDMNDAVTGQQITAERYRELQT